MAEQAQRQWRRRPVLSVLSRVIAHGLPILSGVAVALLISGAVATVHPVTRTVVASLAGAAGFVVIGRFTRRLLPMSLLLDLSMQFPDVAPSRFNVAMRSGTVTRLNEWAAERYVAGSSNQVGVEDALTLVAALNAHDRRTRGHSERVRALSDLMAERLGLDEEDTYKLRWAALLHDIGKLDVPEAILNKPGAPSDSEWEVLQGHPAAGAQFAAMLAPWMGDWIHAIDCHHERYDGAGYPDGLGGTEIPLAARIVAVTDSYETMTAARSYKKPITPADAREELVRCAGAHFDPAMVRAFLEISVPRLRSAMGPVAALAHVPLLGPFAQVVTNAGASAVVPATAGAQMSAAAAMVLAGGAVTATVDPAPPGAIELAAEADVYGHPLGFDIDLGSRTVTVTEESNGDLALVDDRVADPFEVLVEDPFDVLDKQETHEPPAITTPTIPPVSPPTTPPGGLLDLPPPVAPPAELPSASTPAPADAAQRAAARLVDTVAALEDGETERAQREADRAIAQAEAAERYAVAAGESAAEAAALAGAALTAANAIGHPDVRAEAMSVVAAAEIDAALAADSAAAAQASAVEAWGFADQAMALVDAARAEWPRDGGGDEDDDD